MSAEFGLYNGASVVINFAGINCNKNMDDDFIQVTPAGPAYTVVKGHDGSMTRVATNEQQYDIVIKSKRTSSLNILLTTVHQADRATDGGAGVAPFFVKDPNGSGLFASDKCWIEQGPPLGFSKAQDESCEWKLTAQAPPGAIFVGGNNVA